MPTITKTPKPSWTDNPALLAKFRIGRLSVHGTCYPFNDNPAINVGKLVINDDVTGEVQTVYFVRVNKFVHSECRNLDTAVKRCLELRANGITQYMPRFKFDFEDIANIAQAKTS